MKTIKYLLLLAIGMVVFYSCSQTDVTEETVPTEQTVVYTPEVQELIDFQYKLEELNKQTFTDYSQTRGFKDIFKKFVAVVASDAFGCLVGSIGGPAGVATAGITASLAAVITPIEEIGFFTRGDETPVFGGTDMNECGFALASTIIPAVPGNGRFYTIDDSIGYYHNKVLLSLKRDITSETLSLDTLIVKVADETYQPYKTSHATIVDNLQASKSSFDKITNNIMPNIHQDADIDAMMERFSQQYPDKVEFAGILKSFLHGLSNIEPSDNDGEYLNKALELLDSTVMNPRAKLRIRSAVIVANASYQLWDISEE